MFSYFYLFYPFTLNFAPFFRKISPTVKNYPIMPVSEAVTGVTGIDAL